MALAPGWAPASTDSKLPWLFLLLENNMDRNFKIILSRLRNAKQQPSSVKLFRRVLAYVVPGVYN